MDEVECFSNFSLSTDTSSKKDEHIANKVIGQFYSLDGSLSYANQQTMCLALDEDSGTNSSECKSMDIDECSGISQNGGDAMAADFDETEETEVNVEKSVTDSEGLYSKGRTEYEEFAENNIEQQEKEADLLKELDENDEVHERGDVETLNYSLPRPVMMDISPLQQRNKDPSSMRKKRKPKRNGPISMGLIQRIRTFRSATSFAQFQAYQRESNDNNNSDLQSEYPFSNRKSTVWGVDLILSSADSNQAILKKHE